MHSCILVQLVPYRIINISVALVPIWNHIMTTRMNINSSQKWWIYQANAWKNSFNINGIVLQIHQTRRNVAYKIIFQNLDILKTWHHCLSHPGIEMIWKITGNSIGHHINNPKFPESLDFVCTTCAMGKSILISSYLKIRLNQYNYLNPFKRNLWFHSSSSRTILVLHGTYWCIN